MNKRKKFGFATAAAGLALLVGGIIAPTTASAGNTDHTLVVNGVSYASYKEAGSAWHFETPAGVVPVTASVAERSQTWDDDPDSATPSNGLDHLPCNYGIHWISNDNNLTISHCLEAPTVPTVPPTEPTVPPTEPTVPPTEPTVPPTEPTVPPTEPTVPPTEPTVPPTEPTVPPTEPTVPPTDAPTTSVDSEAPTTTVADTTTTIVGSEGPTTTVQSESGGPTTTAVSPEPGLPRTGASQNALIVLGLVMIFGGLLFIALTRRPDEA